MRRGSLVLVFLLGVVLGGGVVWLALDRGARAPTADLLDGTGPGATAPTPADGRARAALPGDRLRPQVCHRVVGVKNFSWLHDL